MAFLAKNQVEDLNGEAQEAAIMLFENTTGGILHGVTSPCADVYGITISLVNGNNNKNHEFRLDRIFPELFEKENFERALLLSIPTTLNTSKLREEFVIEQDEDSFDQSERVTSRGTIGHSKSVNSLLDEKVKTGQS